MSDRVKLVSILCATCAAFAFFLTILFNIKSDNEIMAKCLEKNPASACCYLQTPVTCQPK